MRRQIFLAVAAIALACGSPGGGTDPLDVSDITAPDFGTDPQDVLDITVQDLGTDPFDVPENTAQDLGTDPQDVPDITIQDLGTDPLDTVEVDACDPDPAGETCDGVDNDCDGLIDEDLGTQQCGLGVCFHSVPNCIGGKWSSCNPLAGAKEEICNGKDDDCDGTTDEDFPDIDQDGIAACLDNDDDGDGTPDASDNCPGKKNPLQTDTDLDGFGDLCDPDDDDDGVTDFKDNCPLNANPGQEDFDQDGTGDACDPDTDSDVDDDGVPNDLDCAPQDPNIFPGQTEACNSVDDDCDEVIDPADAMGCQHFFADIDADGFGVEDDAACLCEPDYPYTSAKAGDCSPFDDLSAPGFVEYCDGLDNDCDSEVDEGLGFVLCGKGVCQHAIPFCTGGDQTPCDPLDGASEESCDGLDNDCDGETDEGC